MQYGVVAFWGMTEMQEQQLLLPVLQKAGINALEEEDKQVRTQVAWPRMHAWLPQQQAQGAAPGWRERWRCGVGYAGPPCEDQEHKQQACGGLSHSCA